MKKKSLGIAAASLLGLVALSPMDAAAVSSVVVAAPIGTCVDTAQTGFVAYPWEGMENTSTSSWLTLECSPPVTTRDPNFQGVRVVGARAIDNSTAADTLAFVFLFDNVGNIILTGTPQQPAGTGQMSYTWLFPVGGGFPHIYVQLPKKQGSVGSLVVGVFDGG